jgi:hypothetical protein
MEIGRSTGPFHMEADLSIDGLDEAGLPHASVDKTDVEEITRRPLENVQNVLRTGISPAQDCV